METTRAKRQTRAATEMLRYPIYEIVKGKPIYYKGYKDLQDKSAMEELPRLDNTLQAWLKFRLSLLLGNHLLPKGYELLCGTIGIQLSETDKRIADVAVFKDGELEINEHFVQKPPIVTLEIDFRIKASMEYIFSKVTDYHSFGVKKVIWIFTKNKKIMVAPVGQPWLTLDWSVDVEVVEELVINLADIVSRKKADCCCLCASFHPQRTRATSPDNLTLLPSPNLTTAVQV